MNRYECCGALFSPFISVQEIETNKINFKGFFPDVPRALFENI